MGGHTQPDSHFGDTMPPLGDLLNRFDLEFFWITFAAHMHLSDCHFLWL